MGRAARAGMGLALAILAFRPAHAELWPYAPSDPYPDPRSDPPPTTPSGRPPPSGGETIDGRIQPAWYYCDGPVGFYPYVPTCQGAWRATPVLAPPPKAPPPPDGSGWQHCDAPKGYYPYVEACAQDWTIQTAGPPEGMPNGPKPQWLYCLKSQEFYPYVETCNDGWRVVSAAPPPPETPRSNSSGLRMPPDLGR